MSVAFRDVGSWLDGTVGLVADKVIPIPTGQLTGDLILIVAVWKDYSITAQISGYTEITEFADGTTVTGNGTGSIKVGAWYKVALSDTEADPTLDFSTTTNLLGQAACIVFSKSESAWVTPSFVTAAWPSQSSGTVSASSTVTVPDGSLVVNVLGIRDDGTISRSTGIDAASGVTWASSYQNTLSTFSVTTGNDMSGNGGYRRVTTGSAGVTLRAEATLAAIETGTLLWVVLADVAASVTVTPTTAALVLATFAPTIAHQVVVPPAGSYAATVMADVPAAYWRLGESSGTVADNAQGTATYDGTYIGTYTQGATGLLANDADKALSLGGAGYVHVPTFTPAIYDTFTIEAWVKWTSGYGVVVGHGTNLPIVYVAATGQIQLDKGNTATIVTSTTSLVTAVTSHVVVTKTGSTVKIWIDGIDRTGTVTNATMTANWTELGIGADRDGGDKFNGVLDEVAYYSTVLSSTQVLAHYNAGVRGVGLALTTYAPSILQGTSVTPTTATLTLTTYAPTATATNHQLVTPTTTALVTATFAPTISLPQTFTPATATLTLTTFASTVTASNHQLFTPTTTALTLTTFAATVSTSANQQAVPTTVALILQAFAPTITASDHKTATPTTLALTLTAFAPTVTAAAGQVATPTTASLVLTTFTPTVTASDHKSVTPATATLTLATYAPQLQQAVTPTTASLTLTTFAPQLRTGLTATTASLSITTYAPTVSATAYQVATPPTATLALTLFVPVISTTAHQIATPTTASLVLTTYEPTTAPTDDKLAIPTTAALAISTFAPAVSATAHLTVTPTTAALTTAKFAPTVSATAHQTVVPATASLTLATFAPTVTSSAAQVATPTTATLVLTTYAPTVTAAAHQVVTPTTAALTITTYAPTARLGLYATPTTVALVLATYAPTISTTFNAYPEPLTAELLLTTYAPFTDISGHLQLIPPTLALYLTTYPPTAEQHSITPLPTPIYGFAVIATGPGAGVGSAGGGATVTTSEGGSTAVTSSGPSARVTIR